jgi:hypothetical protein
MLPKLAFLTASGQALPAGMGTAALVATALWSVGFILVATAKFEKMEC